MTSLDAFLHVEIVHPDPDAAAAVLTRRFRGAVVEERTAEYIEQMVPGARIVHVLAGPVVFQIIRPPAEMPEWAEQLETQGPSVFALSFRVDDYDSCRDAFIEEGAEVMSEFDPDFSSVGLGAGPFRAGIVDARGLLGCRLELIDASSGWFPGEAP